MVILKGFIIFINVFIFFLIIVWVYDPNNKQKIEESSKIPFMIDDSENK
ncbi:MAG TPA: hypothetical protein ACYCDA_01765 [Candidatus Azoamicus sp.]